MSSGTTPLDAVGLGNPTDGAPTITPPDRQNFTVPNQAQIQQHIDQLGASPITTDQSGVNGAIGQEQTALGNVMNVANGTGPSAANMATNTGLQNGEAQSMGATQGAAAGANPLAALRQQQQARSQSAQQTIAAGAQARAQEQMQAQQVASGLMNHIAGGQLAGASQRLQADIASRNLLAQAVQNNLQLAQQQQQGNVSYEQLGHQIQMQQRQDFIQGMAIQQANIRTLYSAALSTAGSVIGGALSTPSTSGAGDSAVAAGRAVAGVQGPTTTAQDAGNIGQYDE